MDLLKTKLRLPPQGSALLSRARLVDLLGAILDQRLILLSAPAGYGKTTLLTQFAKALSMPWVFYRLDPDDNDPASFFSYLVEGLSECFPKFGGLTRSLFPGARKIAYLPALARIPSQGNYD